MANSTSHFLSNGAVSSATRIVNKWPHKYETKTKQPTSDQLKQRNLTLKQTSNELFRLEMQEYESGLRSKPPKHLSGEYIRIIENKGLAKLKAKLERHNLKLSDLLPRL